VAYFAYELAGTLSSRSCFLHPQVWPLANLINYKFVPLSQRVLFIQGIALGWNVYLSLVAQRSKIKPQPEAPVLKSVQQVKG
jgi:hypothetical protein